MSTNSKSTNYCDIYFFSPNKRSAIRLILESFLAEIKNTLVKDKISNAVDHGNVILVYHWEWVKFATALNNKEKRLILKPYGLLQSLVYIFPNEMLEISKVNSTVSTVLHGYNLM